MEKDQLLTEKETAETLGVTVGTLRNWRVNEKGPEPTKIGRTVWYRESSINKYLDEQTGHGIKSA